MPRSVEFYYDYGSPTSYLAWRRLPELCAKNAAEIIYRPVLLGGIFKATGNASPVSVPAKGRYMLADLQRFAHRYEIPMCFNPHFPVNTLGLMRGAFAALDLGILDDYNHAMFTALWVEEVNLADPDLVREVLTQAGLPTDDLLEAAHSENVKARLKEATTAAVERGLFGCPTMFVGEQMFFGQDRLDFVEAALAQ